MKDKTYLYYIYYKVKDRIQREKQVIQSYQDVHVYGLWWMEGKLLLYDLSLYINSFESMAISFFSWTFMCPHFFPFFFLILGPSCVHIFLIAHASLLLFLTKIGERDQRILWSIYFVEWVDGTMLTSQRSIARGCMVCTWILIMKAWKEFSQRSQQFDKAQCKPSSICVHSFQDTSSHGFGRIFGILKRSFARGFSNF